MSDVTSTLEAAATGDAAAMEVLHAELYDRLRKMARRRMASERGGHTLSATALVHEAYLKLVDQDRASFQNRAHFLAVAAMAMRRVLVSHARKRGSQKRGSGERAVTLDDAVRDDGLAIDDIVGLDAALTRLAELSERQALVVVYRAFGAMTHEEVAEKLGVSVPTARRDYRLASAWLRRELSA